MLILGIDPGLNVTGYGVVEAERGGVKLREAGVVRSRRSGTLAERVKEIHDGVRDILSTYRPDCMALEQLYSHYDRPRTAILMGHARGAIVLAAAEAGVAVESYASTQVKRMLTGNGRAPKGQVQLAIQRELSLRQPPEPPDVADALAIALCHFYSSKTAALVPPAARKR